MADLSQPEPASAILARLAHENGPKRSTIPQDVRQAVQAGLGRDWYRPHPDCPCERCARVFRTIP